MDTQTFAQECDIDEIDTMREPLSRWERQWAKECPQPKNERNRLLNLRRESKDRIAAGIPVRAEARAIEKMSAIKAESWERYLKANPLDFDTIRYVS